MNTNNDLFKSALAKDKFNKLSESLDRLYDAVIDREDVIRNDVRFVRQDLRQAREIITEAIYLLDRLEEIDDVIYQELKRLYMSDRVNRLSIEEML